MEPKEPIEPFYPFVKGVIRCPRCHRERPMEDLIGEYDVASDSFKIRGISCTACQQSSPPGIIPSRHTRWGAWRPKADGIRKTVEEPTCPYCGKVMIPVENQGEVEYLRCPGSPIRYRLIPSGRRTS